MERKTSSCCDLLAVQDGRRQAEEGKKKSWPASSIEWAGDASAAWPARRALFTVMAWLTRRNGEKDTVAGGVDGREGAGKGVAL
jgi:hypothetical protein